jgi:beta-lactamase class A
MAAAAIAALMLVAAPAGQATTAAPTAQPTDAAVRTQAEALLAVLAGHGDYDRYFATGFRDAVPRSRLDPLLAQLRATLGEPKQIETLTPEGRWSAMLVVRYSHGTATMRLAVEPAPPHLVSGLLITGTAAQDDSFGRIETEIEALPGRAGLGLYALTDGSPTPVLAVNAQAVAPLGSAFKLFVLAEAARQVAAGERHWDDVVPLGAPSLPSGILQSWPPATPLTLQALATLMISISDNTATDTLVTLLGRDRIDAMAAANGGSTPVLTTREAFVLKTDAALRGQWQAAGPAGRRALLANQASTIAAAPLDPTVFAGGPLAPDSVEWFASPRAMVGLLDRLRRSSDTVRAMLAVNHGADPGTTARLGYLGFKGGSEPGVITLNFLAQAKNGQWYAVAGNWHRSDGQIDEAKFLGLMSRALALVAAR